MPKGYRTHEALTTDLKLYFKLVIRALVLGLVVQLVVIALLVRHSYKTHFIFPLDDDQTFRLSVTALKNYYLPGIEFMGRESKDSVPPELRPLFAGARRVPHSRYVRTLEHAFGPALVAFEEDVTSALWFSLLAYLLSVAYVAFFLATSGRMTGTRFVRGARLILFAELQRRLRSAAAAEDAAARPHLDICGLSFPRDLEGKHILIMGATGTGKSVLFNQVVAQINERRHAQPADEKMIIYDVKGEFLSKHYEEEDAIFYPFDARSLRWTFFNEIRTAPDFDVLAKIIFTPPKETHADPFWNNAAKDVFVAGLRFLHQAGARTNRDIWGFFSQGVDEIAGYIKQLPPEQTGALKHIAHSGGGPAASVISTLMEKISWFQYITDLDGDFSFRDYIRSGRRNLFLLNIKNYAATFRPLMTFVFDLLIRETLSLPDTTPEERRRVWFCIDEIGSLDQISVLFDLLTVGRSKGGCMIVANQDLGKIEDIYGRANMRTFYNNFNTDFILRLNDPDTAEFLSRSIGDREVIKKAESRSMSPRDVGDRATVSDQDKTERVLLPSEFMHLPDLTALAKFSAHGIAQVGIPSQFHAANHNHFLDKNIKIIQSSYPPPRST